MAEMAVAPSPLRLERDSIGAYGTLEVAAVVTGCWLHLEKE